MILIVFLVIIVPSRVRLGGAVRGCETGKSATAARVLEVTGDACGCIVGHRWSSGERGRGAD